MQGVHGFNVGGCQITYYKSISFQCVCVEKDNFLLIG